MTVRHEAMCFRKGSEKSISSRIDHETHILLYLAGVLLLYVNMVDGSPKCLGIRSRTLKLERRVRHCPSAPISWLVRVCLRRSRRELSEAIVGEATDSQVSDSFPQKSCCNQKYALSDPCPSNCLQTQEKPDKPPRRQVSCSATCRRLPPRHLLQQEGGETSGDQKSGRCGPKVPNRIKHTVSIGPPVSFPPAGSSQSKMRCFPSPPRLLQWRGQPRSDFQ